MVSLAPRAAAVLVAVIMASCDGALRFDDPAGDAALDAFGASDGAGACTGVTPSACAGPCVDLASDPANCGACGVTCSPPTSYCSDGQCTAACRSGLTSCSRACVDLGMSPSSCGACGSPCGAGEACVTGKCACMGHVCAGACVNPQTSDTSCGTCGNACAGGLRCRGGACK